MLNVTRDDSIEIFEARLVGKLYGSGRIADLGDFEESQDVRDHDGHDAEGCTDDANDRLVGFVHGLSTVEARVFGHVLVELKRKILNF